MIRFRFAALVFAAGFIALAGRPAAALDEGYGAFAQTVAAVSSTDETVRPVRRPRTRIEVRPDYTGAVPPGTRRECAARLVQEFRPSGTVIVPRMRCWWVRG